VVGPVSAEAPRQAGRAAGLLDVLGWRLTDDMPPGRLLVAAAVNWFGSGLFRSSVVVFAVAALPVGPGTVGAAFALGGAVGVLLSIVVGRFADRHDVKAVLVGAYVVQGALFVAYAAGVHDRPTFLAATIVVEAVDVAIPSLSQAVIASLSTGPGRVRYASIQRSLINVSIGLGALLAAVLLVHPTRLAFAVVLAVNGLSYVAAAGVIHRVAGALEPTARPPRRWPSPRRLVATLRGRAVLLRFALLDGVLSLYLVILNVGLPLWITLRTDAPRWLVGLLYCVNTLLVVLFQTRVTTATTGFLRAARGELVVGGTLLASCVAIGLAAHAPALGASQLLLVGLVLLTCGELVHSSVSWQVAFDQTDRGGRAGGLAVYGVGRTTTQLAGPLLLAAIVHGGDVGAWIALGAGLTAAALVLASLLHALPETEEAR
jgi:MFS family permease